MKKMKQYFLKKCNVVLVALLGVFGFSCSSNNDGYDVPMYGTPLADFVIKGAVMDKTNEPIEGIQVKFVRVLKDANGNEVDTFKISKENTNEDGRFKLTTQFSEAIFNVSTLSHFVRFSDTENGLFENKTIEIYSKEDFEQTRPKSGFWDKGEFIKTLNVQLTPITEEDEEETEE